MQKPSPMSAQYVAHGASPIQPNQRPGDRGMRSSDSDDWVVVEKKRGTIGRRRGAKGEEAGIRGSWMTSAWS